jgi:Tfx family DNA-binding protein
MGLTEKEIIVLQLRAQGLTQVEVAKRLDISQAAVSDFEKNAKQKFTDAERTIQLATDLKLIAAKHVKKGARR